MKLLQFLLLAIVLTATFIFYGFQDILFMRPNSVHMWRQADCASYTLNYYQNDITFFTPQTHTQTGKNGFAASEFPIIYYFTAQLYKVFGPHEYLLRLVNLTIFVVGLFCLFALARDLTESYSIPWLVVLFVASSTYLVYYANNFLVNSSALGLVFCGWRAFFLYKKTGKVLWLWPMAGLFLIATLLKVDAGISFVAIAIMLVFEQLGALNITHNLNKQPLPRLALMMLVGGLAVSWYAYAAWFNEINGTGQNLLGIYPIWELGLWDIASALNRIGPGKWAPHFQSYPALIVTAFMYAYLIVRWRQLPALHRQILVWLSLGCGAYFILWFQAFADHDYYLINLAILPVFIWLLFLYDAKHHWKASTYRITVAVFFVLSAYNIYNAHQLINKRYYGTMKESAHPAIYTIEPYLRSIGIARTDLVISVPDLSPNITLYLMNNPGWTEAFNTEDYNPLWFKDSGAKYLIISDSSYLQQDYYKPLTNTHVGEYKGVNIYKLK